MRRLCWARCPTSARRPPGSATRGWPCARCAHAAPQALLRMQRCPLCWPSCHLFPLGAAGGTHTPASAHTSKRAAQAGQTSLSTRASGPLSARLGGHRPSHSSKGGRPVQAGSWLVACAGTCTRACPRTRCPMASRIRWGSLLCYP